MPRLTMTDRVLGGILITLAALLLSVLECFYVNARSGTTPIPLVQILTPLINTALPWLMSRVTAQPRMCPVPAAIWVIVALLFASSGPAGDVVVPGNWQGQTFLLLGMLGAAVGVFLVLQRALWVRRAPAVHRDAGRTEPR